MTKINGCRWLFEKKLRTNAGRKFNSGNWCWLQKRPHKAKNTEIRLTRIWLCLVARLNSSFSVCITRHWWSLPAVTLTVTLVVSYIVYKYNTKVIGLTTEVNIISTSTKPMYCFTRSMYYVHVSQVSGVKTEENEILETTKHFWIYLHCTEISIMLVTPLTLLSFIVSISNLYLPLSDLRAVRIVIDALVSCIWILTRSR